MYLADPELRRGGADGGFVLQNVRGQIAGPFLDIGTQVEPLPVRGTESAALFLPHVYERRGRGYEKADEEKARRDVSSNVIKIVALTEGGDPEEMSTSETMCSFSRKRAWQRGRRKSAEKKHYSSGEDYATL